jgi:hypothetical protein
MEQFKYKSLNELIAEFKEAGEEKIKRRSPRILTQEQREAQRARIARYKQTERGREAQKNAQRRYNGKRRRKPIILTEREREAQRARDRRYRNSEKGRLTRNATRQRRRARLRDSNERTINETDR